MKKKAHSALTSAAMLSALFLAANSSAQQSGRATAPLGAELRTMYFQQDFEGLSRLAEQHASETNTDPEALAWYTIGLARSSRQEKAAAAAQRVQAQWPGSAWDYFARSVVAAYGGKQTDALSLADSAAGADPNNRYAWWVRGFMRHRAEQYDSVVILVDSVFPHRFDWAELQIVKANALLAQAARDSAKREAAFELFAEARERDPHSVNAHFFPAATLVNSGAIERAWPLLLRTRELSPFSYSVLQVFATAAYGKPGLSVDERRKMIREAAERVLLARPSYPGALSAAATAYRTSEDSAAVTAVEERILRDVPASGEAEALLAQRHRALADSITNGRVTDSISAKTRLVEMLWAFADRPSHERRGLLGEAYLSLFFQVGADSTTPDDALLRIAQGAAEYSGLHNLHASHSGPPAELAERRVYLREAEQIARKGMALIPSFLEMRGFSDPAEHARTEDWLTGLHQGTLGWIYVNEGRYDEARRELDAAEEVSPEAPDVRYYQGRLAEMTGNLPGAEMHYATSYAHSGGGASRSGARTLAALRRVYEQTHGSPAGWTEYLDNLSVREREIRRTAVLSRRNANPAPMLPFSMESLTGGERFTSASMDGKVAVINFWGLWCGPCVQEAPDIQKIHERYANDPNVMFVTVDYNDPNLQAVRDWMAKEGFDFPVLLDNGYVASVGVRGFPTTWFVNREGKIEFTVMGAGPSVFEEFVWRIDALLTEPERGT